MIFRNSFFLIFLVAAFFANAADSNNTVWFDGAFHQKNVIQVKFHDDSAMQAKAGKLVVNNKNKQHQSLINALNASQTWHPAFSKDVSTLNQWRNKAKNKAAKNNAKQSFADLTQYFYMQTNKGVDTAKALAQLRQSTLVEGAYPVAKPVVPPLPPDYTDSSTPGYQRYVRAAPDGIDVDYATQGVGGKGAGIDICDVEYGFNNHIDLLSITKINEPYAFFNDSYYDHGTAVLGMLKSANNLWGTTGMVAEANVYFSPVATTNIVPIVNIQDAIADCMSQINTGGIILIEQQMSGRNGNYVPVEWDAAIYAIIQTASAMGYVVVEAAGNGGENLDHVFYQTAQPGHTPFTAGNDSGAILVGAGASSWKVASRSRLDFSTYGNTVDLQGWGQDIVTTGYGNFYDDDGDLFNYTLFSGTSGASPMVTAAAAIIQANYIAKNGSPALPATIKQLLINTGAAQTNTNGENIGPLPDLKAAINSLWDISPLTAPVISPSTGAFSPPLSVTIDYGSANQNSSNTHIRYTLDGSDPTIDSYIYIPEAGDTIQILYTTTVKAVAFQSFVNAERFFESPITTETLGIVAQKVATPVFSPQGGTFSQGTLLTMTSNTAGATIKYRTDGRSISAFYPGTTYNGPISLSPGSYYFSARAYKDGYYKSDMAYAQTITVTPTVLPAPTLYPNSGTYVGNTTVYIGSTVLGATIRYTTDGSTPTSASDIYVNPINIEATTVVKARVYLSGYTESPTISNSYDIVNQATAPVFSPASGTTANDSMLVTLSSSDGGASIRYTTNGTDPVETSPLYSTPISLAPGQHEIRARSYLSNASESAVSSASYSVYDTSITVTPPTISPVGGVFNAPVTVTMSSDTEGVSLITYTLDGSDPATAVFPVQKVYSGPFELLASNDSYFIKAKAYLNGTGYGEAASATFTVVDPVSGPVATPTITPESGEYNNSIAVSVQAPDFSSPFNIRKLYVTRNGDTPFADFSNSGSGASGVYNFNLAKNETVQAISAQAGWFDSALTSRIYLFKCATPVIATGGTYTNTTDISISTVTTNSTIYYTLDGSEPTTADMQYSSPITLTSNTVVKAMCTRNNFTQSDTNAAIVIIETPPVAPAITTQPAGLVATTCADVTLSVAASGTAPLTYQWFKDGSIVGGANESDLELIEVTPANSGNYIVKVVNAAGEISSNNATLIVPIFSSSFEAGETAASCANQTQSSTINKIENMDSSTLLKTANSEQNTSFGFSLNTNSIYGTTNKEQVSANERAVEANRNPDEIKGSNTPVIIPALNLWAKMLLISMFLLLIWLVRSRLKPC